MSPPKLSTVTPSKSIPIVEMEVLHYIQFYLVIHSGGVSALHFDGVTCHLDSQESTMLTLKMDSFSTPTHHSI
jgi:hypothetical protein